MPAVSILTPSFNRHRLLELQHGAVMAQTLQDFEWLILDDSPEPHALFPRLNDPRIHYHHSTTHMSIGAKRNWLALRAQAPLLAHFDDDDYYAPAYLATMLARLAAQQADITKLSGWFVFDVQQRRLGYWESTHNKGLHFQLSHAGVRPVILGDAEADSFRMSYAGYGFSYVYRREVWQQAPFPDQSLEEDNVFVAAALERGFKLDHFSDQEGLVLHISRTDNASISYPQFVLPGFLLRKLFGPGLLPFLA